MAGRMTTLSGRLIAMALVVHAVLLPVLFIALAAVVRQNMTHAFVDDARVQARLLGDSLELEASEPDETLVAQLDSAVLGGRIVHASLKRGDVDLKSTLMSQKDLALFREDFEFGDHGDGIYYLSLPIDFHDDVAILRLGFDEQATQGNFRNVQRSIVTVLLAYLAIMVMLAILVSRMLTRPLQWLRRASRAIASGDYDLHLETDSKLLEINELTDDLEQMRSNLVKVNARLRHAQRLESLGTLAGGVAHEFNNALQPVLLYTDLALEDLPADSPAVEYLGRVLELADRAKGLSHQILTFSRFGEESELEIVEIAPTVEEAITLIRALLPATVDLRVRIECPDARVRCDPPQIQQLLVNLCNNAFQALEGSDGVIRISLYCTTVDLPLASRHPHLEAGDYVVLQVEDNGCGMDAETIERVFEPFFTKQGVGQGTGLGLSVAHGIVRRHSGEIQLSSEPGVGTRFRIYLPRVTDDAQT